LKCFVLSAAFSVGVSLQGTQEPPNFVVILADDLGYGDVGFTGNDIVSTPNMDRLASEGTQLSSFYVSPVCAPTRAGFLTGRYHRRTGVIGVVEGREFMTDAETTLAELLKDAGYATGIFGKWHLGENYPWTPRGQGFDEFIGFLQGSSNYFDVELVNKGVPYPTKGYLTDVLTDLAIDFLERRQDKPFFLYLPYSAPHTPLEVPDRYVAPYAHLEEKTAKLYGMIESLDENLGRLLGALERTGLDENTIVICFSDNGPIYTGAGQPTVPNRFNANLRGAKFEIFEGGVRVPMLVRLPQGEGAGEVIELPASHIDLLPTILDFAEVEVPESLGVDGVSLRPALEGEGAQFLSERTLFMYYPGEREQRIGSWEKPFPGGTATRWPYKLVNGRELYNLAEDPSETRNLATVYPEILTELTASFEGFWDEVRAENPSYPRVPVGHAEENPSHLTSHWANLEGGPLFQFSDDPPRFRDIGVHGDWLARWRPTVAVWRLAIQTDGMYQVSARVRSDDANASTRIGIELGGHTRTVSVPGDSTSISKWFDLELGKFEIAAGEADLKLRLEGETLPLQIDGVDILKVDK